MASAALKKEKDLQQPGFASGACTQLPHSSSQGCYRLKRGPQIKRLKEEIGSRLSLTQRGLYRED